MSDQTENLCSEEFLGSTEIEDDDTSTEEEPSPGQLDVQEAESALAALSPTLLAIPQSEVRPLKVSTTTAVGIGLAYAHSFAEDRPLFAKTFATEAFDPAEYDDLSERAKAFWQADILMRQELNTEGPFRLLVMGARPLRSKMLRAATYLWGDDPELSDVVASIRKGNGYANRADDLGSLATLFTEHWDQAEGKCDVTLEDIAEAERLGAKILQAMSPLRTEMFDDARCLRYKAAEYLRRGIEEVRAAAAYIFRKDPTMMERYPSLFIRRRTKGSNGKTNGEATSDSVAPTPTPEQVTVDQSPSAQPLLAPDASAIAQNG